MHVGLLISGGVPNAVSGGGALTAYTVLRHALDAGRRVTVFALHDVDYYDPTGAGVDSRIAHLRELGADVVPIPSRAAAAVDGAPRDMRSRVRRAVSPRVSEIYPYAVDASDVADAVAASGCEVVFVYHFDALAASREIAAPRVVGVGDPTHLPKLYRWRDGLPGASAVRSTLQIQALLRRAPQLMVELLDECASYGAFAAHHAEWLRRRGAARCLYLRTPVPDEAGTDWASLRRERVDGEPPRILLLGHLKGIVTIDGMRVFRRMLPYLDASFGRTGYEVDVVGGYEPPADLASLFDHPAIRRHGHVDDPGPWLREADVLLVPTSIPLGIRVRIITGFSYGTPIVTHRANALGIPELEHESNGMLGTTPQELADAVVRVVSDSVLRKRLALGGRKSYERFFAPPVAAAAVLRLIGEAVPARVGRR